MELISREKSVLKNVKNDSGVSALRSGKEEREQISVDSTSFNLSSLLSIFRIVYDSLSETPP